MAALVLAILMFLTPAVLRAQPADCVDPTAAWTKPYSQGNIQFITYYVWSTLFSVGYRNSPEFHIHVNVPSAVAQPFSSLTSADARYDGSIKNVYQQALLAQTTCPLLNEDGTILLGQQP